jgi:hypothetical protein
VTTKLSRKPDDVLTRVGAGGTRKTVDRIVKTWQRATPSDIEAGVNWYGRDAADLLDGLVNVGARSREHAAAVVAHLSPRTTWTRNVAGAYAMVSAYRKGEATSGEAFAAGRAARCMERNVTAALQALYSDDPLATLNGPKVKRFAWNLLGYREAVTVDVWAARVAIGETTDDPEKVLGWAGVYDAIEHAYRLAARRVGVDPTTMQATTWIVARNGRAS